MYLHRGMIEKLDVTDFGCYKCFFYINESPIKNSSSFELTWSVLVLKQCNLTPPPYWPSHEDLMLSSAGNHSFMCSWGFYTFQHENTRSHCFPSTSHNTSVCTACEGTWPCRSELHGCCSDRQWRAQGLTTPPEIFLQRLTAAVCGAAIQHDKVGRLRVNAKSVASC